MLRLLFSFLVWGVTYYCSATEMAESGLSQRQLNQIQYIGSHNSYHIEMEQSVDQMLLLHQYGKGGKWPAKKLISALAYSHYPLLVQLALGARTFELDLYEDVAGGKYAQPGVRKTVENNGLLLNTPYDLEREMSKPGFKVLHMADIDFRSQCARFVTCLAQIKNWSNAHPHHIPIIIQLEAKSGIYQAVDDSYKATESPTFTAETWRRLEGEVLSVFAPDDIFKPADMIKTHPNLSTARRKSGWPKISELAGKVMFLLIHDDENTQNYTQEGRYSHRLMFANVGLNRADSVFAIFTKPHKPAQFEQIQAYRDQGYLVYTRADANTVEARTNDIRRQQKAIASGAQIISTDYLHPDARLSSYRTVFSNNQYVQCNDKLVSACR